MIERLAVLVTVAEGQATERERERWGEIIPTGDWEHCYRLTEEGKKKNRRLI